MRTLAACSKEVLHHGSGEKEFWSNFLSKASLESVFTHVVSNYANILQQKKAFASEKSSASTGLVWDTNMAAVKKHVKTLY